MASDLNKENRSLKRQVCMLANGHSPFDTRIFLKEARSLQQAGNPVIIIVPHKADEVKDNILIQAVPMSKNGWQKLFVTPLRIFLKARKRTGDPIFIIHDSDLLFIGLLLKAIGRTVVYDAHEDTPLQISYQHWIPKIARKPYAFFYGCLERICGKFFDSIIVAEPIIARYFPPAKTVLLRNFPISRSYETYPLSPYADRENKMVSLGTLSKIRGLFEMLEAAKIASEKVKFEFVLGGKFAPPELEHVVKEYDVTFPGWFSHEAILTLLFRSRLGIFIAHPVERYKTNYPVKIFEFMAAALPVIISREGEAARFVREANCGILVDPMNVQQIADAIEWVFNHPDEAEAMGKRGQALIFSKYNWENEVAKLIDLISSLSSKQLSGAYAV